MTRSTKRLFVQAVVLAFGVPMLVGCLPLRHSRTSDRADSELTVPEIIAQTVDDMVENLSDVDRQYILALDSEHDMIIFHMGYGVAIRHHHDLWGASPLAREMYNMGIRHPDDMSGALLRLVWQSIHGKELSMDHILRRMAANERESLILMDEPCPDCPELLELKESGLLVYLNDPNINPSDIIEPEYPEVMRMFRWYKCANGHEYVWTSASGLRRPTDHEIVSLEKLLQRRKESLSSIWE